MNIMDLITGRRAKREATEAAARTRYSVLVRKPELTTAEAAELAKLMDALGIDDDQALGDAATVAEFNRLATIAAEAEGRHAAAVAARQTSSEFEVQMKEQVAELEQQGRRLFLNAEHARRQAADALEAEKQLRELLRHRAALLGPAAVRRRPAWIVPTRGSYVEKPGVHLIELDNAERAAAAGNFGLELDEFSFSPDPGQAALLARLKELLRINVDADLRERLRCELYAAESLAAQAEVNKQREGERLLPRGPSANWATAY